MFKPSNMMFLIGVLFAIGIPFSPSDVATGVLCIISLMMIAISFVQRTIELVFFKPDFTIIIENEEEAKAIMKILEK